MKLPLIMAALALAIARCSTADAQTLEAGFASPPEQTKPWCYWYWISDNISKEGITRDLEAMARVGIGEAFIGNIFLDDVPGGTIKVLSPQWWDLVAHALREGGRTGVNIGMFNCPGWSQSGGPWITPQQSMRYLASSEVRVTGPARFTGRLPAPNSQFQDVALIAFPTPHGERDSLNTRSARVSCTPAIVNVASLADGDASTVAEFPRGAGQGKVPVVVEFEVAEAFVARSLQIVPADQAFRADCELQASESDGTFKTVRRFKADRSNMGPGVGFMPRGPVAVSFPATTARRFRLRFTGVHGGGGLRLAEITLSGAARLESFVEKQLGKMHPTPLPMWDTYLWPTQSEPDDAKRLVPQAGARDLTGQLAPDGTLTWEVPAGDWTILRTGMTPTGMRNGPASPEGSGLEVDKMNRGLAIRHFDAFIGEVLRRVPAADRKALRRVVADSYEMGSQNWTDGLDAQFRDRYGYDPRPWLPVLTGRLVGSADRSERFLWDLRRLVADRVATDYVGGLRDACRVHGLELWLENYGHWGFPAEFLQYGGASDRIGGEYWVTGDLGSIECRAASSCANTYGRKFVSAEAFTGGPPFQNAPGALKARGDWSFCEGVNHLVLHVYIHQPWEDKVPGVNAWFGTEFNRHNTWFEQSRTWVDYLRRCCWLLQQGTRVADVAYFIGEDSPKMTGTQTPPLPPGRDFDYINAEVIEKALRVENGLLTLPHGTSYRVLVLPDLQTMRPGVLRKIRDLVSAGAVVLGTPPSRSPSMENFPQCDEEVRRLAGELWGGADTRKPGQRQWGKGTIVWGRSLHEVLTSLNLPPDFVSSSAMRFTHRRSGDTDIYFVANPRAEALTVTAAFRAGNRMPELWWPDSGRIEAAAVYDIADGVMRMPLSFDPHGSVFVVFRTPAAPASQRIISVRRDGRELLSTTLTLPVPDSGGDSPNNFTFAAWVKPDEDTTLVRETNRGIVGLNDMRNDALAAPHGDGFGGGGHAGCGLSVGTNGVCVFEHGAGYFAPTLVHAASIQSWTHVAVVYRDGQPSLYLNGKVVRTGMKSEHTVHFRAGAGSAQYRGQLGSFSHFPRALADAELADLARTMDRPDQAAGGPIIHVTGHGKWLARATQPGDYELVFADGNSQRLNVKALPPPLTLSGPWEVSFQSGRGAPRRITFDQLADLRKRSEESIRHHSGRTTYRRSFELPGSWVANAGSRHVLHLGEVRDLAMVRLNGKDLGTLWLPPWRVDITSAIQAGTNTLEVDVVNVWNNRLAGDAALPADQRRTFLLSPTVKAESPLLPAGLIGPVTVHSVAEVQSR